MEREGYDMALIKCPECGRDISDKAEACPNCGMTLAKTKNQKYNKNLFVAHWLNIIAFIFPGILIGISELFAYFSQNSNGDTSSSENGVSISLDAESAFNSELLSVIMIIGALIFIIGILIYFMKSAKLKITLSIIYLIMAISDFALLLVSMAIVILMTCGVLSVILIPGILQIIAGAKFISGSKSYGA